MRGMRWGGGRRGVKECEVGSLMREWCVIRGMRWGV